MRKILTILILSFVLPAIAADMEATKQLAQELANEGSHRHAATEYRRLALTTKSRSEASGYYWAAASQYLADKDYERTAKMLDRTEDLSKNWTIPTLTLRAESAYQTKRFNEAEFYLKSLLAEDIPADHRRFIEKRTASTLIAQHDPGQAFTLLEASSLSQSNALPAVLEYGKQNDKRPWIGGVMGILPGIGYLYTGEWANAVRSLLLNGIFIYGMSETAGNGEWGFFSVISFFELTWYTGSIYGSIDAVHRYNRDRMEECISEINGDASFMPDLTQIPIVALKFQF